MPHATFTFTDLKRILLEGSGAPEGIELDENVLDTEFGRLRLRLAGPAGDPCGRVEREYGVSLEESILSDAPTPVPS